MVTKTRVAALFGPLVVLATVGCDTTPPLDRLQVELEQYPEYSVTLQDMREDGYYHQYGVVIGEPQSGSDDLVFRDSILDWQEVGRTSYDQYREHLGMVILSKGPDGVVDRNQHPPAGSPVGAGPGGEYGSNGTVTRQTNPNFFRRQQARQAASSRSFGDRVRSRTSGGTRFGGK